MTKALSVAFFTAVAIGAAASAAAQTAPSYVGVNVGRADLQTDFAGIFSNSEDSTAYKVYAGYRVNDTFGVEAGYLQQGDVDLKLSGTVLTIKPRSFYAAATATLPLANNFALFGKLGASANRVKLSNFGRNDHTESRTTPLIGVGVSYAFTPTVSAVLEFEHFGKVLDESATLTSKVLTAGVRASF